MTVNRPINSAPVSDSIAVPRKDNDGAYFDQLPVNLIQKIACYLPLPDLASFFSVNKRINQSISHRIVQKAQERVSYDFCKMRKCDISPDDVPIISDRAGIQYISNSTGHIETHPSPETDMMNNIVARFGIYRFPLSRRKPGLSAPHHNLYVGTQKNGLVFLSAANKELTSRFIKYNDHDKELVWSGELALKHVFQSAFYSFFSGKTFDDIIGVYEQINQGTDAAVHIRRQLGFRKTYY